MKELFKEGATIKIQRNLDTEFQVYTKFTYKKEKYNDDVSLEYLFNEKGQIIITRYLNEGIECLVNYAGLIVPFEIKYSQIKFD